MPPETPPSELRAALVRTIADAACAAANECIGQNMMVGESEGYMPDAEAILRALEAFLAAHGAKITLREPTEAQHIAAVSQNHLPLQAGDPPLWLSMYRAMHDAVPPVPWGGEDGVTQISTQRASEEKEL